MAGLAISCAHRAPLSLSQPPRPQPVFERQVQNAVDAGDGDVYIQSLRARMAAEPDNLQIRLELAKTYRERGSKELALEHYRLAAGRFPDSAEVQLLLAKTLRDLGLRQQGADGLDAFLKAHPQQSPEFPSWLGILRDELQQWPEGEAAHRAALAFNPRADYLYNNLGYNLLMQGRKDEAADEFRVALQLNPRSVVARNNLGMALANTADQAVSQWQSVSDPASAHSNMAALLIEQGRYADARRELDVALGYNRNHPAAWNNLRLVSQLDGKPAIIPIKPVQKPRWDRWKSALRRALVGPEQHRERSSTALPETGEDYERTIASPVAR